MWEDENCCAENIIPHSNHNRINQNHRNNCIFLYSFFFFHFVLLNYLALLAVTY